MNNLEAVTQLAPIPSLWVIVGLAMSLLVVFHTRFSGWSTLSRLSFSALFGLVSFSSCFVLAENPLGFYLPRFLETFYPLFSFVVFFGVYFYGFFAEPQAALDQRESA